MFNHALSQGQIVALFANAIGASAIAPAIATQPASQTLFAGQPATWSVVGGGSTPLSYQWQAGATGSGVFSNLTDGGAISGSSSSTLTVYPVTAATAGDYRMILANSAGSVTSSVATLTVLPDSCRPMGRQFQGHQHHQRIAWSLHSTRRALGMEPSPHGTLGIRFWIPLAPLWRGRSRALPISRIMAPSTPESALRSSITLAEYSGGGGGANNPLLSTYVLVTTNAATLTFSGVPPGIYNLALYGVDGTYHDRGIIFTVAGMTNTLVNTQDTYSFSPGDNTAIFQNVPVVNGTLNVSMMADPLVHPPDFNEGDFDAVQIQLVTLAPVLTNVWNGSTLKPSWPAGSILLESTNVTGPWTTNNASSPFERFAHITEEVLSVADAALS